MLNCLVVQVDIPSEPEDDEDDPDGRFAFKRKRGVKYMAVSWTSVLFPEIICSGGFINEWGTRSPPDPEISGGGRGRGGGVVAGFPQNDDGDGNENGKSNRLRLASISKALHVHHAFCIFLCRRWTTTT